MIGSFQSNFPWQCSINRLITFYKFTYKSFFCLHFTRILIQILLSFWFFIFWIAIIFGKLARIFPKPFNIFESHVSFLEPIEAINIFLIRWRRDIIIHIRITFLVFWFILKILAGLYFFLICFSFVAKLA